jgi:hypothetical protein
MEPPVRLTGETRTAFYTRDEADAVQRPRTSVIVSRESTNTGFTQHSRRHGVRSLFRDRTPHDVHRFALSPSFAASAARTTSFRLGRHHLLLRDERTVSMFPTDDCFPTLRRRALAPRPFPYAFHRTEPLTFSRRHWRFGGPPGAARGVLFPYFALPFEVPHLTTTEPLTPLSLPSIRAVALSAQSRFVEGRRDRFHRLRVTASCFHDPRCLPSFGNPTRPLRASFPRREEPPGPWSIPRLCRRGPTRNDASSHARFPKVSIPLRGCSP